MVTSGYRAELDAGRRFMESIKPGENIALLFHGDADGCCAGAIMYRTLRLMGDLLVFPVFMEKGESIYSESLAKRIQAYEPSRLIVMDMGSRNRPVVPGLSTMIIDHHKPDGVPPADAFVTSFGVEPPAPASLLTYQICRHFVQTDGLSWLAAVGTAADLGIDTDFDVLRGACDIYGKQVISEAAVLVNSGRRSAEHDIATPFAALVRAESPLEIVNGEMPEALVLAQYRQEVSLELKRVLKTAPRVRGRWALLKFRSPALVHTLLASAWTRRLKDNIVIAANYGYTQGNVHFSVRSAGDFNLIEELGKARPSETSEFAQGHVRATGGIVSLEEFAEMLRKLGFSEEVAESVPPEDMEAKKAA
jgi:single-stranded DNA-specific DHH superfamily exonuclease